ncbi:hypothetical protein [Streptomyces sp. RerS4]|uniref:hypothetical protein n=1 Tax=Streptomyces sp. RerS4 TaxID=2942449 RepID=UPI00201BB01A|nr:hypothetical protein [Streptomyces sp. RerS4]UQX04752.1 hypothetical protein M4D82_32775 [Streptomyces sp. RerS4]
MSAENRRKEFRVEIDGLELSDELIQRIDDAVRKAVLRELASVDLLQTGTSVDLLSEGFTATGIRGGSTQGIHVRPAPPQ